MKAILILIVTVGSQGNIDRVDSSMEVQQIGFASLQACERAAARLNSAGRRTSDYAKTFGMAALVDHGAIADFLCFDIHDSRPSSDVSISRRDGLPCGWPPAGERHGYH